MSAAFVASRTERAWANCRPSWSVCRLQQPSCLRYFSVVWTFIPRGWGIYVIIYDASRSVQKLGFDKDTVPGMQAYRTIMKTVEIGGVENYGPKARASCPYKWQD